MLLETARRLTRYILGFDSAVYRKAAAIVNAGAVIWKEGLHTYKVLAQVKGLNQASDLPTSVTFRKLKHPIWMRPNTPDADTAISNIIREEYGQFQPSVDPQWMIDAGAYIGDTTAYFLSRFPSLRVIALEPNPPSYSVAVENLKPYAERAILIQKGLWSVEQRLRLDGNTTSAAVKENGQEVGVEIECTSIPALLQQFSITQLSILKMDIEGAEGEIFASNPEIWLGKVDLLIIEFHGQALQEFITRVLKQNGFSIRQFRSVWYCERERNQ